MENIYPSVCFPCESNKIRCANCRDHAQCNGCSLCKTPSQYPCIHCDINCEYEHTCTMRAHWIMRVEGKIMVPERIQQAEKKEANSKTCEDCDYDYACARGIGMCPEETCAKGLLETYKMEENVSKKKSKVTYYTNRPKVWDTKIQCITDCHHKSGVIFHISIEVILKLTHLQELFPDVEWTVYGNAEKGENDEYYLNDIIIPKQRVGAASVDDIQCDGHYNCIIHKHPGKTPGGFSHEDREYANSNHDFSLLIGSEDLSTVIGEARVTTDCGKLMRVPITTSVNLPKLTDEFFLASVANIERKVVTYTYAGRNEKAWENTGFS